MSLYHCIIVEVVIIVNIRNVLFLTVLTILTRIEHPSEFYDSPDQPTAMDMNN